MNIYLIAQEEFTGYTDHYDSAIVAAPDELTARSMNPARMGELMTEADWEENKVRSRDCWATSIDRVTATLIGTTSDNHEQRLILASYNAG